MGERKDLISLAEGIIDSYQVRVKRVGTLMMEATEALKNQQLKQQELITMLRDILAKCKSLRKRDFDISMEDILTQRWEGEKEVIRVVDDFKRWGETKVAELRNFFSNASKPLTTKDFAEIKEIILFRQEEREKGAAEVLREFHREQEELNTALQKLASKGEMVRIKDFKSMIKALQVQRKERESEIGAILKELDKVSEEVREEWQRITAYQAGGGIRGILESMEV